MRRCTGWIPLGIGAYALNVCYGLVFLSGMPDQYLWNPAFRFKVAFMFVAGLNVLFFYSRVFTRLQQAPADSPPPFGARVAGAVSLTMWIGVMSAGRLLTFFRPPVRDSCWLGLLALGFGWLRPRRPRASAITPAAFRLRRRAGGASSVSTGRGFGVRGLEGRQRHREEPVEQIGVEHAHDGQDEERRVACTNPGRP